MLLETLKKILAAVGVYLCMLGLLKAAIHTNYAIQKKDGRRMAVSMSAMALLFFHAVSAGSCCGRLSDGETRIETVSVLR